jgi:hypothetical protein
MTVQSIDTARIEAVPEHYRQAVNGIKCTVTVIADIPAQ